MIQEDLNEPTQDMQIPNLFGKICREVNRKLAAGALSEQILDYVFDSISIFIPFDRMGIALLENEGQKLRLSWVRSKMAFSHIVENYSASITGSSLQNVIETGEPRILNDLVKYLAEHPNSQSTKLILEDGIRSSLTCPLYERNRPVGIVFFSSANPNTYKQEHVETFQDISNELAIVIEHGRLRNFFDAKKKESLPVARVIHDLRSPLSIIQAYLDLTSRESWFESLNPDVKKMLSTLQRNSNYMVQMLNEMAEIKQLNEKRPNEGKEEIPLQSFLQEMIGYGQALARQKEIGFISDIQNSLPTSARLNAMHIRRILDNLFSNAIKFSQRGTKMEFSVKQNYDQIVFSVTDEGQGIPAKEVPLLFQEFSKTSTRPTEGEPSTGLGLAIAKNLVALNGGEISVDTEVGRGSTFEFWLPFHGLDKETRDQAI